MLVGCRFPRDRHHRRYFGFTDVQALHTIAQWLFGIFLVLFWAR
jgi:hypothetical protein